MTDEIKMKTKTHLFLEDILETGKNVLKYNLLIVPKDNPGRNYFFTLLTDTLIGGLAGLGMALKDGNYEKAFNGAAIGLAYGGLASFGAATIDCMKYCIKNYIKSLEKGASLKTYS